MYYFDGNGNRVIGVNFWSSNGRFYYFNPPTGVIQNKQGWINWNSKRYYSAANGVLYNTRFISVSGKKYYAGTDAAMKNGVFKVGTSYYYAVPSTYIVQTTEGFISWNGHRYYAKKGGELFKSITLSVRGVKYHLQSDGAFMTGMHKWGDALYYANSKGELRTVKGFFTVNGNSYFSQLGGKLLAAMTFTVNGQPYHALSNGAIVKGVHKWGSYYYYSDPATGKIRTTAGFVKWNNKLYYVLSGGKLITGRVYTVKGVYYEADATGASVKLDAINKLLSIMRAQVGTATGKKYWTWYYVEHRGNNWPFKNTDATPWCGAFVAWCFNEAGLFSKISAVENYGNCGYVPSYTAYANKNDKWVSTSTAKAGDIIIFGSGSGRHVGIVESNDGKTITTIEGNAGPTAVSAPGLGAVVRNTYSVTASKIRGIIRVL